MQVDNIDTASLHFESILENDINQMPETSGNGRNEFLFEQQHENYDVPRVSNDAAASYENTDNRPLFFERIEREKMEFSQKNPTFSQSKNELADNVLFNKFRESADSSSHLTNDGNEATNQPINEDESNDQSLDGKLKDSNSVSCEDLLEFADKKPKGKERGIESDEVRIMTKVLGPIVSLKFIFYF